MEKFLIAQAATPGKKTKLQQKAEVVALRGSPSDQHDL